MGKTAVFVLSTLQQIEPVDGEVHVLVMCHTRELALQIKDEYVRFTKYMPNVKTEGFFGGIPISNDIKTIKENCPVSQPVFVAKCRSNKSSIPSVRSALGQLPIFKALNKHF